MHYYKRNIGDYHKKAGRLSMLQHGSYTLLIDACYDREKFPTEAEAIDWCWASNQDEIDAVKFVLNKFFDCVDGVYVQARIQEEIDKYHENATTNQRIAREREEKKRARSVHQASTVEHEPAPNHKPVTNNHKPITKDKTATRGSRLPANWKPNSELAEWSKAERPDLDLRKVFAEFTDYWNSVAGSKGVKLDWNATWRNWVRSQKVEKQSFAQQAADVARQTVPLSPTYDSALKQIEADRKTAVPMPADIRDKINAVLRKA